MGDIEVVKRYQTTDDRVFETILDAEKHQLRLNVKEFFEPVACYDQMSPEDAADHVLDHVDKLLELLGHGKDACL